MKQVFIALAAFALCLPVRSNAQALTPEQAERLINFVQSIRPPGTIVQLIAPSSETGYGKALVRSQSHDGTLYWMFVKSAMWETVPLLKRRINAHIGAWVSERDFNGFESPNDSTWPTMTSVTISADIYGHSPIHDLEKMLIQSSHGEHTPLLRFP